MTYHIINDIRYLDNINDNVLRDITNLQFNENDPQYYDSDEETEIYDSDEEEIPYDPNYDVNNNAENDSDSDNEDESEDEDDPNDSDNDEANDYDVDVLSDARFVVGGEVVGRNIYNTISDLEDAQWISYEILEFLTELYDLEEERNENPNNYQGNVHESETPAYIQMDNIYNLIVQYEQEAQDEELNNQN